MVVAHHRHHPDDPVYMAAMYGVHFASRVGKGHTADSGYAETMRGTRSVPRVATLNKINDLYEKTLSESGAAR